VDWNVGNLSLMRQQQGAPVLGLVVSNPTAGHKERPDSGVRTRVYRLEPQRATQVTTDSTQAESWLESYQGDLRRRFPFFWEKAHSRPVTTTDSRSNAGHPGSFTGESGQTTTARKAAH
jgi:hypothetical protein